jgi:post-segregation antitoxin (ccd killing protein)
MLVTISAKIPKSLREKLKKYGVRISDVVRCALEEEVLKREEEKLRETLDEICAKVGRKISEEDVVSTIRAAKRER